MAALLVIIVILVGVIIALFYFWREKPKELQKEIERLRKSVVSGGLDFEQIEYRISGIKDSISEKRKQLKSSKIIDVDMDKFPYLITEKNVFRITFSPVGDVARLTIGEFIDKLEKYGLVQYPKSR